MSAQEFDSLYLRISPRLRLYAQSLTGNYDASLDLYQETSLKVYRYKQRFDPSKASLITWAAQMMRQIYWKLNSAVQQLVSYNSFEPVDWQLLSQTGAKPNIEKEFDINNLISGIKDKEWLEFALLFQQGYSYAELAEKYAMTVTEAEAYYQRGMRAVRRSFNLMATASRMKAHRQLPF